jgi:hypothetical protein
MRLFFGRIIRFLQEQARVFGLAATTADWLFDRAKEYEDAEAVA